MIPIQTTYLKPRTKFLLLFFLVPVAMIVLFASDEIRDKEFLIWALVISVAFAIVYFIIGKSYVMIDNHGITIKNIFKEKSLDWKDIQRFYLKIIHTGKSTQRLWYFEAGGASLNFSTNLYSRKSLQSVAEALVSKCTHAQIEPKIREMAEGKFPWYIF